MQILGKRSQNLDEVIIAADRYIRHAFESGVMGVIEQLPKRGYSTVDFEGNCFEIFVKLSMFRVMHHRVELLK